MPKVSVLLPSYNNARYLRQSIDSVLAQTFTDFELIISDNASTDESWEIIQSYHDPRLKAFRNAEPEDYVPRVNRFIQTVVQGEYIATQHSDDIWRPDKLQKQVELLDAYPDIGAVFSHTEIIDATGHTIPDEQCFLARLFRQDNKPRQAWLRQFFYYDNTLCYPSSLIRKQCHDDCGLFNPLFWQLTDFDMWVRLCLKHEVHVIPEPLIRYRWHGKNASTPGPENMAQNHFELPMILEHYTKIKDLQELQAIFPEARDYCQIPNADPQFILGMIAIATEPEGLRRDFGQRLLYESLSDPARAERIQHAHHFSAHDFTEIIRLQAVPSLAECADVSRNDFFAQAVRAFTEQDDPLAFDLLQKSLAQNPDHAVSYVYLALLCARARQTEDATTFIEHALVLAPERADFLAALGEEFLKNGQPEQALHFLQRAVQQNPDLFIAYPALAEAMRQQGKMTEAFSLLEGAALLPSKAQDTIIGLLTQWRIEQGNVSPLADFCLRLGHAPAWHALGLALAPRAGIAPERLLPELQRHAETYWLPLQPSATETARPAAARDNVPITIAFLVGDCRRETLSGRLESLLLYLPPERFQTVVVITDPAPNATELSQRFGLIADTAFRIEVTHSDADALRALARVNPHVLVDLDGISVNQRLSLFFAAPVLYKCSWSNASLPLLLGIPSLCGEKLARSGKKTDRPLLTLPGMGEPCAFPELPILPPDKNAPFTLGCLVSAAHYSRASWQSFARLLGRRSDARLRINLAELGAPARDFIVALFVAEGVDPARLDFLHATEIADLGAAYNEIDLGLAPLSGPGDLALPLALWMEKPYLALASDAPWSRRPAAWLAAVGENDCIADSPEALLELACAFNTHTPRHGLRQKMRAQPGFDPRRYAEDFAQVIENALLPHAGEPA